LTISALKFAQYATPRVFRGFSAAFQFNSKIASTRERSFSTELAETCCPRAAVIVPRPLFDPPLPFATGRFGEG
jgi:hypothetical protein